MPSLDPQLPFPRKVVYIYTYGTYVDERHNSNLRPFHNGRCDALGWEHEESRSHLTVRFPNGWVRFIRPRHFREVPALEQLAEAAS